MHLWFRRTFWDENCTYWNDFSRVPFAQFGNKSGVGSQRSASSLRQGVIIHNWPDLEGSVKKAMRECAKVLNATSEGTRRIYS